MTSERRASRICSGVQTASRITAWMGGLAAMRAPRCAGATMSRALLNPIPDWPAPRVCHAVLCEAQEEPFGTPLPDLVVDLCSTLFLLRDTAGCG